MFSFHFWLVESSSDAGRQDEVPLCPDGDGRRYWPPRPMQRPRRDFVVAEEMPGDGDGKKYQPLRPTQSLRRDFVVAEEMPVDGDSRKYQPPRPAQK